MKSEQRKAHICIRQIIPESAKLASLPRAGRVENVERLARARARAWDRLYVIYL